MLGRVVRKGVLHHYGKISDNPAISYPVKFEFWIAADGYEMRAIVWNRLCEKYFSYVQALLPSVTVT